MTSIEQIIREKLSVALAEEKKRIAASLLEVAPTPAATVGQKKKAKGIDIQQKAQKLNQMQSKAGTSKDPNAMRTKLDIARTKLALAQKEMGAIKK